MIQVPGTTQTINKDPKTEVDAAKAWVFNKSAELNKKNEEHSSSILSQVNSDVYMNDLSYMDGTNPNTYTNLKKNYIDELLADSSYTPPNTLAQELWGQYTQVFKKDQINKAIAVEIGPRMEARINLVTKGVENNIEAIRQDPLSYDTKVAEFDMVMGDNNAFIPPAQANELRKTALTSYKNAYIDGMINLDPGFLIDEIVSGKHDELSDQQLFNEYSAAMTSYRTMAKTDIDNIYRFLKEEEAFILNNNGQIDGSKLANIDLNDLSSDELLTKLCLTTPWFGKEIKVESNDEGTYIFSGKLSNALESGEAVPVKNLAQGKRISKHLSRLMI
tara:strand:+ start:2225 stop:3220 length:996 start_codon:yes stop_codon:yes gene_type:complete